MTKNLMNLKAIDDVAEARIASRSGEIIDDDMDAEFPTHTGNVLYKPAATTADTIIYIKEGANEDGDPELPNLIIVKTELGAGEITLANHAENTLTAQFLYKGNPVDTLPGDGFYSYGFILKPGTDTYIIDANGAEPYLYEEPGEDPIAIFEIDRYATSENDRTADPLEFTYALDMGSYNNPLLCVWCYGTGGGTAAEFTGMAAGAESMDKVFQSKVVNGNFTRVLQFYILNDADAPADGNVLLKAGEAGGGGATVVGNRMMGAFIIENADQVLPTLLSVTTDSEAQPATRFHEESSASEDTLNLASIAGEFLAVSIMVTSGAPPLVSDGQLIDEFTAINHHCKLSYKNGQDQVIGFTVSSQSSGYLSHMVIAIEKDAS